MRRSWPFPRPLVLAFLAGTLAAAAPSPPPAVLAPGVPVERGLAAGESHAYRIVLAAGHPARVTVEQRAIDVAVEVAEPDGRRLAAVDAPLDRQGPETVLIEPKSTGSYRIAVRAREAGAPPGRYEIRLETETDPRRLAAGRALMRAGERYLQGTPEARRQALAAYGEAREAWRALGERREEARALYAMAVLSRLTGDARRALAQATEVAPLWHELGDRLWEGSAWNEAGLDRWLLGDGAGARAAFESALALQREAGDRYGEGAALSNLCLMDLSRGDLAAGLACYDRALPVLREAGAGALEVSALLSSGRAWDVLGEPDRALARYQEARGRLRELGDRLGEARAANQLGLLRSSLGDTQEALALFGEALDAFRALGDRRWQADALHNLGLVYQGLGEPEPALGYFDRALKLRREVGDAPGEATTRVALAQVRQRLGRPKEALADGRRALDLYRAAGDRFGEGVAATEIGRATLALGDPAGALASLDRAVELLAAAGSPVQQAEALLVRGDAYEALRDPERQVASLSQALDLARGAGFPAGEAKAELSLAWAERHRGRPEAARAHAAAAISGIESLRTRIGGPDLRASYSAFTHDAYELQVDLLMEAREEVAALELTERARARTLLELLAEAGVEARRGGDPALLERRAALLRRLSAKSGNALRAGGGSAGAAEREALVRDLDVVEAEIRERSPGYAALVQPRPLDAAGIRGLLDPDTLLLVYSLGRARSWLWAVTPTSVDSFALPGRAALERAARRVHEAASAFDPADRAEQEREAAALGRALLGPVAKRLGRRRIAIVPDGALAYVPFAALPLPGGGGETVLARHEVVYLPSASAVAEQRRLLARRPRAAKGLIALADPAFGPGLPPLPGSRREAEAIAALGPPGGATVLLGADASRDRALAGGLAGYRAVHVATHGVLDAAHPALSGLALAGVGRDGRPREGFLHLRDVYDLRLDADLVVLSGCRTALGKEVRGEGLVGLARGFLYAGAPRVVASLWKVEDQATAELMTRFYRALWREGLRPAAALRRAQLSIAGERRWRDPYFWAGFVLEGDWE